MIYYLNDRAIEIDEGAERKQIERFKDANAWFVDFLKDMEDNGEAENETARA